MKPNRSKRNELRRMESWPGLIAEVKHRMQLSPTSVFMHYMPFCSADHGRRGQSNIGKERRIIYFISGRYFLRRYSTYTMQHHLSQQKISLARFEMFNFWLRSASIFSFIL